MKYNNNHFNLFSDSVDQEPWWRTVPWYMVLWLGTLYWRGDLKIQELIWKLLHSHVWHQGLEDSKLQLTWEFWSAHQHVSSPHDVSFLTILWRKSKKKHSDKMLTKESNGCYMVSYLSSEVTWCHCHHILLVDVITILQAQGEGT